MLARRFAICDTEVKILLFKKFCQSFYSYQLWMNFARKAFSTIRVQYNDAYRVLMRLRDFTLLELLCSWRIVMEVLYYAQGVRSRQQRSLERLLARYSNAELFIP